MPNDDSRYFTLSLDSLRTIGEWAADCAERTLAVYETRAGSDTRPREAIAGIREFARGGKRTAQLWAIALASHAAAREVLLHMPAREPGRSRLETLFYELDAGIRADTGTGDVTHPTS